MTSCIPKSKHVKLTQACYPKSKTADAKPNASELQYLAYYAVSRPKKLIKVGSYLRHKNAKDTYRRRQSDVIVSLDICTTLIEKCHTNLNLFAADLVAILQSVFDTKDTIMIEHSQACFAAFCKYHDGFALDSSSEYAQNFGTLLKTCEEMSCASRPLSLVGLHMLSHASTSPAMQVTHQRNQSPLFLSAALKHLIGSKQETLYLLKQQIDRSSPNALVTRDSVFSDNRNNNSDVSDAEYNNKIVSCALMILRTIFQTNDASGIQRATSQILQYNTTEASQQSDIASVLIQISAEWVPIDLRFHVLGACLNHLKRADLSHKWPSATQNLALHNVYILLTSKTTLIGLSTNDVLETLLAITYKLLQSSHFQTLDSTHLDLSSENQSAVAEVRFLQKLSSSMVAITTHSYYKDQTSDLFRDLMQRLSLLETSKDNIMNSFKDVHLHVAKRIIFESEMRRDATELRSIISPAAIVPGLALLKNPSATRAHFASLFLTYLTVECSRPTAEKSRESRQARDASRPIQSALYRYLREYQQNLADLDIGLEIIRNLHLALPKSEIARFIPLLYRLDQDFHQDISESAMISTNRGKFYDTILILLSQCSNSGTIVAPRSGNTVLPDLKSIIDSLTLPGSLDISRDDLLVESWTTEAETDTLHHALSMRHVPRMRLVSSATASRDNLELEAITVKSQKVMAFRVADLKRSLQNNRTAEVGNHQERGTHDTTIEDMFRGIELKPIVIPNHNIVNETLSDEAGKVSSIRRAESIPKMHVEAESDLSTQLGRVIA